jgi:hypothetical protein
MARSKRSILVLSLLEEIKRRELAASDEKRETDAGDTPELTPDELGPGGAAHTSSDK